MTDALALPGLTPAPWVLMSKAFEMIKRLDPSDPRVALPLAAATGLTLALTYAQQQVRELREGGIRGHADDFALRCLVPYQPYACDPRALPPVVHPHPEAIDLPYVRLCLLGDSYVEGTGASTYSRSTPAYLAQLLAQALQMDVEVITVAHDGHTSRDLTGQLTDLSNALEQASTTNPFPPQFTLTYAGFGINDVRDNRPIHETMVATQQVINQRSGDGLLVVGSCLPPEAPAFGPAFRTLASGLCWSRSLAQTAVAHGQAGVTVANLMHLGKDFAADCADGSEQFFCADGMHPNERGQQWLAYWLVMTKLLPALQDHWLATPCASGDLMLPHLQHALNSWQIPGTGTARPNATAQFHPLLLAGAASVSQATVLALTAADQVRQLVGTRLQHMVAPLAALPVLTEGRGVRRPAWR